MSDYLSTNSQRQITWAAGLCETDAMARARQDSVDRHVARWSGLLEDMNPEV